MYIFECDFFSDIFEKYKNLLKEDMAIFIKGTPSNRSDNSDGLKFIAKEIYHLPTLRETLKSFVNIRLSKEQTGSTLLNSIKDVAEKNNGQCPIILHLESNTGLYEKIQSQKYKIIPSQDVLEGLRNIFGYSNIWIS